MRVIRGTGRYFDTVNTITLIDGSPELMRELFAMCARFEKLFSRTLEGSDIWRVNNARGCPARVDSDTAECIKAALTMNRESYGAFDIRVGAVTRYWDFHEGAERVPTGTEITEALSASGPIEVDGDTITAPDGVMLDLGGIAKGCIADRLLDTLRGEGVSGALLDLGGSVSAEGVSPNGGPWRVGIQNAVGNRSEPLGVLEASGKSIVTSSASERSFTVNGRRFHHLLDPATGMPADTGLISATVVSEKAVTADAYATAAFVLGAERGESFLAKAGCAGYVLVTDGGRLIKSPGLPLLR